MMPPKMRLLCEVTLIAAEPHGHTRAKCRKPSVAGPAPGRPRSVPVCAQHLADRIRLSQDAAT